MTEIAKGNHGKIARHVWIITSILIFNLKELMFMGINIHKKEICVVF